MHVLTIHPKDQTADGPAAPRRGTASPKTRAFSAIPLAWITGRDLWPDPSVKTEAIRPLWLMLTAGGEAALRPFVANFRAGRPADLTETTQTSYRGTKTPPRMEVLKSGGYSYLWQRGCGPDRASVVTIYQASLCLLDPGLIDPREIRFVCLPATWWLTREAARLRTDPARCAAILAHTGQLGLHDADTPPAARRLPIPLTLSTEAVLDLIPAAAYFAAYLDRRTRRPLVNDPAFALQIYLAALAAGIASLAQTPQSLRRHQERGGLARPPDPEDAWWWARGPAHRDFHEVGTTAVGLGPGVACRTDHPTLDAFLATEVARYFEAQADRGAH